MYIPIRSLYHSTLSDGHEVKITSEELITMKNIFNLFDKDNDGRISKEDLRLLHQKLGEPLTDDEAKDAVSLLSGGGDSVTFENFALYWDNLHVPDMEESITIPSSSNHTTTVTDGAMTPTSAAVHKDRERKRRWYAARFKFLKARIPTSAIGRIFTEPDGICPSLEYRLRFYYDGGKEFGKVEISPWHDIPYRNYSTATVSSFSSLPRPDGTFNMIVEIPKWSRRKFEIATGEAYNSIKQDIRNGVLREYTWGEMLFNYGAIPQTWEDPNHISPDTQRGGDNDPVDILDIGNKRWNCGSIVRVKVLGVIGLIDSDETDYKIIGISAEDPLAPLMDDIDDVEIHMPGALDALISWLRYYKSPVINEFAYDGKAKGRDYAIQIIEDCHKMWENLVNERSSTSTLTGGGGSSSLPLSNTNNNQHNKLSDSDIGFDMDGNDANGDPPGSNHQGSTTMTTGPSTTTSTHAPASIVSAGLTRSSSNSRLANLFAGTG